MSRRGALALTLAMIAAATLVVWGVIGLAAAPGGGTRIDEIADAPVAEEPTVVPTDTAPAPAPDPAAAGGLAEVVPTLPDTAGLLLLVAASLGCALVLLRPPE